MRAPTPEEIREARTMAGLSISKAAELVYVHPRTFEKWQYGERVMPAGLWELFNLKALGGIENVKDK